MTTLQTLPNEITQRLRTSGQLGSAQLADEKPASVQQALPPVAELVATSLAELAARPEGREQLWQQVEQAAARPGQFQPSEGLVREVLADRYHGTVHGIVTATGLKAPAVAQLLDAGTAAALGLLGGVAAEHHWGNAQQLGQWLRPHRAEPVAPPTPVVPAPLAAAPAKASWFASRTNLLLLGVSFVAVGELGYILGQHSVAPEETTVAAAPAKADGGQYTAIPVSNLAPANRPASPTTVPVPVVLKLKDGVRQVIGAASTESKLYQFLVDPSKEVEADVSPQDWIGFDRIYFDPNKATLTNESLWQLSNVASILKRFPEAKIKLGGYTDNTGTPFRNLQLSKARAEAARDALVSLGVPADRLAAVGFGQLDNIASNDTEEGRAVNRRVSMEVTQK